MHRAQANAIFRFGQALSAVRHVIWEGLARNRGLDLFRPNPQVWGMVKKLLHTRMRVNDLERTVKFYEQALGLKVSRRHTSPRGAQLAFLQTPNSEEEIEICQLPNSPSVQVQPDLMHLAFEVDNLAAFAEQLGKKGFKLSDGPTKTSSGSSIAFIDAPEGYEVELIQRA
jgi:lactoylglutathione lyase